MFNSLVLSALAMAIGMVVAMGGTLGKTSGPGIKNGGNHA
jgi:hypothetical protein